MTLRRVKSAILEDRAEDALGQDVLDEHLFDGLLREVRIDRLAAQVVEPAERFAETLVRPALFLNQLGQRAAELRYLRLKVLDRLLPLLVGRRLVLEKERERPDQLFGVRQVGVQDFTVVLPEDGAHRGLKENVARGVSGLKLLLHLAGQIVVGVLGLPEAVRQPVLVYERAVHASGAAPLTLDRPLRDERPAELPAAGFEQILEGRAHGRLVRDFESFKLCQGLIVGRDHLVSRFEVELFQNSSPAFEDPPATAGGTDYESRDDYRTSVIQSAEQSWNKK